MLQPRLDVNHILAKWTRSFAKLQADLRSCRRQTWQAGAFWPVDVLWVAERLLWLSGKLTVRAPKPDLTPEHFVAFS